jgi:tetratricopeptide (TPR) repeat protein
MQKFFPALMVPLVLFGCSNHTSSQEDEVLSQPPCDKVSDSIHKAPKDAALYYRRGTLLYTNEQTALAEKDFKKAWELNPNEEHALRLTTVLKSRNADQAINFLQEALKKIPGSISLNILLAKGYESKNDLDKALAICNNIISQYPGQLDALMLKSEILHKQDKNAEALAVLEKAYSYAPGDVDLAHQLAFEYADSKNPKVLSLADSLIKADVQNRHAEPYYFKGLYYENTGRYTEAIQYFDEAIRHDYNFLDAYMDKGQTYFEQKKYVEALKTFQLASTVFPTEALPYYWLGKTQEVLGSKVEARLDYERAYGLDKTLEEAKQAADRLK